MWSSGLGSPHPPFWAVGKKSSLIGSLAVSFTLNIQVKQKSQASLCWQRGELSPADSGPGAPGTWGLIFPEQGLPSLTPPPSGPAANWSNTGTQRLRGRDRSPFAGPVRVQAPSTPPRPHAACHGYGKAPTPKSQTSSSCPILFSRLKNKIHTIGEQRSRAALGSTRTKGLCTTLR